LNKENVFLSEQITECFEIDFFVEVDIEISFRVLTKVNQYPKLGW
jgi:hypothetical protein